MAAEEENFSNDVGVNIIDEQSPLLSVQGDPNNWDRLNLPAHSRYGALEISSEM